MWGVGCGEKGEFVRRGGCCYPEAPARGLEGREGSRRVETGRGVVSGGDSVVDLDCRKRQPPRRLPS